MIKKKGNDREKGAIAIAINKRSNRKRGSIAKAITIAIAIQKREQQRKESDRKIRSNREKITTEYDSAKKKKL